MIRSRSRVLANRERCVFIVTTKSGQSYRGVLFDSDSRCLVLRNAEALDGNTQPIPIDGELLLMTADVAFLALVTA
jgi:hypothetical protein